MPDIAGVDSASVLTGQHAVHIPSTTRAQIFKGCDSRVSRDASTVKDRGTTLATALVNYRYITTDGALHQDCATSWSDAGPQDTPVIPRLSIPRTGNSRMRGPTAR